MGRDLISFTEALGRGLLQTKADAITDTDQNTVQVEWGAVKWGEVFMSPTIVILMTWTTKDALL